MLNRFVGKRGEKVEDRKLRSKEVGK